MTTTQAIRDDAALAADRVLADHWNEELFPVDPFSIASRLGLKVFTAPLPEGVSGFIRSVQGTVEIFIDGADGERRRRFTAAHELGHYAQRLRDGTLAEPFTDRRDGNATLGSDPDEIFANEFAAALLMPASLVRHLVRDRGLTSWELARFFDVSPASMDIRLANLGLVA